MNSYAVTIWVLFFMILGYLVTGVLYSWWSDRYEKENEVE